MKTFSKIDGTYTRLLSTLTQQIDTVFGAARASSERGSYYYATFRSVDLITQTSAWGRDLGYLELVALYFAPRSLCGYGFPHFEVGYHHHVLRDHSQDEEPVHLLLNFVKT
ncbi:unnamed protein product [Gordionus sp. m RMFG-2023]